MSDTLEFCEKCRGFIYYPTDGLGRVIATCERCGHRPPAYVPRQSVPVTEGRDAWTDHEVGQWALTHVRAGQNGKGLFTMAERDGLPRVQLQKALHRLVAQGRIRRNGRGGYSPNVQTLMDRVAAWCYGHGGAAITAKRAAQHFCDLPPRSVGAALSNLVRKGVLEARGPVTDRYYHVIARGAQEAA